MGLKLAIAASLACILVSAAASARSTSLERETAACQDDAVRLCGPFIPDHGKIHSCLVTYKAYISPACRALVAPAHHGHHHKKH